MRHSPVADVMMHRVAQDEGAATALVCRPRHVTRFLCGLHSKATCSVRAKKISNWQRVSAIAFAATSLFKKLRIDAGFLERRNRSSQRIHGARAHDEIATTIQIFDPSA